LVSADDHARQDGGKTQEPRQRANPKSIKTWISVHTPSRKSKANLILQNGLTLEASYGLRGRLSLVIDGR
jgi:hypothetical protein